ncbi:hypothetical protein [Insolitispirillum peregrinum]|uniref:hypothetical protein n=1 Tax=Insolitispirillum peregrinum TaxID=80876 RepID=UPI0036197BB9
MSNVADDFKKIIDGIGSIDNNNSADLVRKLTDIVKERYGEELDARLKRLFEMEKQCLMVVKEFKEEIKFMQSAQEDIRRERAQFFATTLRDVSQNLTQAQVDSPVASRWLEELVSSYTQSLNLSDGLVRSSSIDLIGQIRNKATATIHPEMAQDE